jgi:TonB family protein
MPGFLQFPKLIYVISSLVLYLQLSGCWFNGRPAHETQPSGDTLMVPSSETVVPAANTYEAPRADLLPGYSYDGPVVDNAAFDYPYWIHLVTGKISRALHLPHGAAKNLTCRIFLQVNREGELVALRMVHQSGSAAFDQACLEAIRWAEPFPSLPVDYQNNRIGLTVPFRSN